MGLRRWLEQWFPPEPEQPQSEQEASGNHQGGGDVEPAAIHGEPLGTSLQMKRLKLEANFDQCSDVIFREYRGQNQQMALLVYIDGLVAAERVERDVSTTLLYGLPPKPGLLQRFNLDQVRNHVAESALPTTQVSTAHTYGELLDGVLRGEVALALDGLPGAILLSYKEWERRQPEEPPAEPVIRGPREGFTENLRTNTALLRRRLRTTTLKLERLTIGRVSKSDVVIAYLSDVASPDLVREVRRRLSRIQIDAILESGYLEEMIEDQPFSPFSQVQNTERPDIAASSLLEGRVAVLTDGTPFTLIVPTTFFQLWQANEDYYERFIISSALRLLRYFLLLSALVLPSFYVAIVTGVEVAEALAAILGLDVPRFLVTAVKAQEAEGGTDD
ncbi:MAG: spore germination protein, partial [Firmicutes bacterium]|nr:spore germination protein [Bacillota bacterium]